MLCHCAPARKNWPQLPRNAEGGTHQHEDDPENRHAREHDGVLEEVVLRLVQGGQEAVEGDEAEHGAEDTHE